MVKEGLMTIGEGLLSCLAEGGTQLRCSLGLGGCHLMFLDDLVWLMESPMNIVMMGFY